MEKQKFLRHIIENYDDGRARGFYCLSLQLLPFDRLKETLAGAETELTQAAGIKEKARLLRAAFSSLADGLQIDIRLRK